ncbi:LURP-one-related family protein [Isoptericola sp. AK164]|uniref:LURP-one-related/scramblase family protein n=1 Tax=Isoptericola sp. AK164 TaxID=3024246 RepID=UPI00241846AB|nr:LURP-one-related family protein [Isoptericola sp. AK164]
MPLPPPPAGWSRYVLKSTFGMGRDFAVLHPDTGDQSWFVDGKVGMRPKADVKDRDGEVVYTVTGKMFGIPKQMTIADADGTEIAALRAKMFSPVKDRMSMQVPGGEPWSLEGSFIEKDYAVTVGGRHVVQITQKWVTIRDAYTLDVADGVDVGLALAVVWAIDRWVERD